MKKQRKILWLSSPLNVTWYITSKCNLRCSHCYLTDYTKNTDRNVIDEILEKLVKMGVRSITYIGGEPLVRMDLAEIIGKTESRGITTEICTNGILADEARAVELTQAGCRKFQVSLEGHSPELSDIVRGKETFQKILSGAKNLKNAGAKVKLNITISRENYKTIPRIIELAESIGIDTLRLSAFVPFGTGGMASERFLLTKENVEEIRASLAQEMIKSNQFIESPIFINRNNGVVCEKTFGCGAGTHNMIINTDLSLSACDIANEKDRTLPIENAEEIESHWLNHKIFRKWRGQGGDVDFKEVHQHHCHLAYLTYKSDIFSNE